MKPDLRAMFPKASEDFLAANEHPAPAENVVDHPEHVGKIRVPKGPNKTETEYGRILEAQKQRGEILRYEYEGVTFRWLDMRYTPDWFVVLDADPPSPYRAFKAIEVKGRKIIYEQQAIARFKGARGMWPEIKFEMWQRNKPGQWIQLF